MNAVWTLEQVFLRFADCLSFLSPIPGKDSSIKDRTSISERYVLNCQWFISQVNEKYQRYRNLCLEFLDISECSVAEHF